MLYYKLLINILRRRRRLKGIHFRSDTNSTGAEGLSFYYPRLLHCLDQMLAVMSLSQHRVLSSKTVRPRPPCGARCIGHAVSTWSAVCSEAPHSQFGRRRRLKGIHSRPDTNRTGAEGLSFYYPRLLHCLDQMLAVMLLSQHRRNSVKERDLICA